MIPRIIVTLGLCTLTLGACREAQSTTQASSAVTAQDSVLVQASDTTLVGKRLYLSFDGNSSVVEYLSPQHQRLRTRGEGGTRLLQFLAYRAARLLRQLGRA